MDKVKVISKTSGWVAAIITVAYITAVWAATTDGPAGLEVSGRAGGIAIGGAVLGGVVSLVGWMIRAESRASSDRIAVDVSYAVAGAIHQSLNKVADRSVATSNDAIIEAMRDMLDGLRGEMQTLYLRARTQGMVEEAAQRSNVASIAGRRDT